MKKDLHQLLERMKSDSSFKDKLLKLEDPRKRLEAVEAQGFEFKQSEMLQLGESLAQLTKSSEPDYCCVAIDYYFR